MIGGAVLMTGVAGPTLTPEERRILRRVRPSGAILFARNVVEFEQVRRLVGEIRHLVPGVLIAADAEGGRVDRFRTVFGPGPAASALAAAPPSFARRSGTWMGRALRLLDVDVDLAPVVDLDHGAPANALDGRYLGSSAGAVSVRARAFVRGLHGAGVAGCLKHFPGLGGATRDTHHAMASITREARDLAEDLAPFRRLSALAEAVLIGHALYPGLDAGGLPATLSAHLATRLLRRTIGFRGLAICDDLEMRALDAWGDLPRRAAAALAAGCDWLPVCSRVELLVEVAAALGARKLRRRRQEAGRRLARFGSRVRRLQRLRSAATVAAVQRGLGRLGEDLAALG
jgi:beta-N-acetylhexosaminidase